MSREFGEYVALASSQWRLKVFYFNVIFVSFKRSWQECDYAAIILVAPKVLENILQENAKLLV
ncbi:MAG: hypothetical protein QM221_06205 [Bacillota bacterium]|nr:hypothetical protein [Bacillota bacterium]